MNARIFGALLLRDAVVAKREIVSISIRTLLQPVLFVFVFGKLLPSMGMVTSSYTATLMPGVAALCMTTAAIWAVGMPLVQDFGFTREIEDRLLAPVPIELVALEKVASGMLQAAITAAFVLPLARLILGPVPGLTWSHAPLLLLIVLLGGAAFASLGLWFGTALEPQQVALMMSVVFVPMIVFGCVYYPWRGLARFPVLEWAVLVNPLVYVSEGLRAALTPGVPHMPLAVIFAALIASTAVLLLAGLRSFRKRAIG